MVVLGNYKVLLDLYNFSRGDYNKVQIDHKKGWI